MRSSIHLFRQIKAAKLGASFRPANFQSSMLFFPFLVLVLVLFGCPIDSSAKLSGFRRQPKDLLVFFVDAHGVVFESET